MKLLVIGSAPQANICINSQFVSGYHAEIIILDNGDMYIVDKNSTNGTTLNGMKLTPGVETPVRRGDGVVFANAPLDWAKVPDVKVDTNARKVISIGNHARNTIHVAGDRVSRFHATIKQMNDGKWLICDHSTNGTTLNGTRLPKGVYVKIKKGDQIKCAGVAVDNPVTGGGSSKIGAIIAAACVAVAAIVCCIIFIPKTQTDQKIVEKNKSSVLFLYSGYHYKLTAGTLDLSEYPVIARYFGKNGDFVISNGELTPYNGGNSIKYTATGFYISENGLVATNLHVARPWLFDSEVAEVENLIRIVFERCNLVPYLHMVKVSGELDFCYAALNGNFWDEKNAISCHEYAASDNQDIDVAVMQARLQGGKLPSDATYVDYRKFAKDKEIKTGGHTFTLGFPGGGGLQEDLGTKTLQAIGDAGSINNVQQYNFGLSALTYGGASGSPVFNEYGKVIGVISYHTSAGYNYAVKASEVVKLLNSKNQE